MCSSFLRLAVECTLGFHAQYPLACPAFDVLVWCLAATSSPEHHSLHHHHHRMAALLPLCGRSLWLMGLAPRASQILGTALHCLRPCHDVLRRGTGTPVECVRRISCTRSGKPLLFRSSRVKSCEREVHHTPPSPVVGRCLLSSHSQLQSPLKVSSKSSQTTPTKGLYEWIHSRWSRKQSPSRLRRSFPAFLGPCNASKAWSSSFSCFPGQCRAPFENYR